MTTGGERLQKVIAQSGITSRRKAEQLIIDGKVTVNGKLVKELGTKVTGDDTVEVNGIPIEKEIPVCYLLYKPRGVISSVKDDKNRKVVTDLLEGVTERIYPIGRLDYDSSGLLLLTNDGEFANLLMHPKYGVEKVYVAKIKGLPDNKVLNKLRKGVKSESDVLKAESYQILSSDRKKNNTILQLTLKEGKNRHVRRMMEALGYPVIKLKRERYGMLTLEGLKPGEYRSLTPKEIKQMRNLSDKL